MNKSTIILSVLLAMMTIVSLVSLSALGSNEIVWQQAYNKLHVQWCELSNDHVSFSNDLIIELQSISYDYDDIELLEWSDCWEWLEDETQVP